MPKETNLISIFFFFFVTEPTQGAFDLKERWVIHNTIHNN